MKEKESLANKISVTIKHNWHLIAGAAIGAAAFLVIFGLEPLRYSGVGWTLYGVGGKDITQHQTGWEFYRHSPWSFPQASAAF